MFTIKEIAKTCNIIKITTTDNTIISFHVRKADTIETVMEDINEQHFKFDNVKSLETALRVLLKPNSRFRSIKKHVRI
jgi:hypothetical protein